MSWAREVPMVVSAQHYRRQDLLLASPMLAAIVMAAIVPLDSVPLDSVPLDSVRSVAVSYCCWVCQTNR
jgi:hypothetical protein